MDVGTVSSDDVLNSYETQLTEAHRRIAMLEAALKREQRAAAQARIAAASPQDTREDPREQSHADSA